MAGSCQSSGKLISHACPHHVCLIPSLLILSMPCMSWCSIIGIYLERPSKERCHHPDGRLGFPQRQAVDFEPARHLSPQSCEALCPGFQGLGCQGCSSWEQTSSAGLWEGDGAGDFLNSRQWPCFPKAYMPSSSAEGEWVRMHQGGRAFPKARCAPNAQ